MISVNTRSNGGVDSVSKLFINDSQMLYGPGHEYTYIDTLGLVSDDVTGLLGQDK